MVRSNRGRRALAALGALALVAAGCGGDDDDDTAAAAADAEPAAADDVAPMPTSGATSSQSEPTATATDATAGAATDRADWPESITFGVIPAEDSTSLQEDYANLVDLLQTELGVAVEVFQATDYAGIIEGQISGEVDLAQYGPFSYVLAKQNGADIDVVGALAESADDDPPGYQSYGITRGDNAAVSSIGDFAGKTTCFVDPGSTSGYLYPTAGLIEAGIDPTTGVTPVFAGGHDASALSVVNGDCEVGFAYDTMVSEELIADGQIAEGDLKVVWESEVIAQGPMAVSLELPETLVAEIKRLVVEEANVDAFVASGRCASADGCTVTDDGSWGWIPVDDAFYDGVRAVCDATQAEACAG